MLTSTSAVKLREYERIFTGSNQQFGYENPILDFTADTTLQLFPTDKTTYFHYPITAPSGLLIDSTLAYSGAVAGEIPYRSDKIWKKMANYKSNSIWGNSNPIGKQTGVCLCSWLSGNPTSAIGVWVDRWYNPGYIDPNTALFLATPLSSIIVDIPSEMILESGCWYKYYHVGNIQNNVIVNNLSGTTQNLKLWVDDWTESPIDKSPYHNSIEIKNYTDDCISSNGVNPIENPLDNCLKLNGTDQHSLVMYNSSYTLSGDLSYSIWAYCEDWTNVQGCDILSNNYRGGWALKYNSGFLTPIIFAADRTNGNIIFINSDGKVLMSKTLPTGSNPVAAAIDENLFTWVVDNGVYNNLKHVYKVDYNGDIRHAINVNNYEILKNISIDQNNVLWILSEYSVSAIDSTTLNCLSVVPADPLYTYLDINLTGAWIGSETSFTIDNDGYIVTPTVSSDIIAYQKDDTIWELNGTNNFYKKTSGGTLILSGVVGNSNELSGRSIAFTNEFVDGVYQDYVWFLQEADQYIYKYDINGIFIQRVDISEYDIHPYILGDITGYQKHRKFNYLKYNKIPQIQTEININQSSIIRSKYFLSVPVTAISNNDWHLFTFTFNQSSMNFYMDSILRDSISISYKGYIYYDFENPLLIGANVGKVNSLDEELDLTCFHFKGSLDDLRIYGIPLNTSDIRHLYLNKYKYQDLQWNIPTGEQSYLEEIERFFKFKMSGLKSQYYNIKLIGLQITDETTKSLIEDIIKNTIKKVAPAYTELFRIIWE